MQPVTLTLLVVGQSVVIFLVWLLVRDSRRRKTKKSTGAAGSSTTRKIEAQELRAMLAGLASITNTVDRDVDEHTTEIETINHDLAASMPADENLIDEPIRWVARIIEANTRLKQQLEDSQEQLKEQERKLNNYMMMAATDPLTGLANRRAFSDHLENYFSDRRRRRSELALVMFDLNGFKQVNDTNGHLVGDRVLRGVARVLSYALRERDMLARYGGDEFALILEFCGMPDAMRITQRARMAVGASSFRIDDNLLSITVSAGLAMASDNDTADSILRRADAALYASKNSAGQDAHYHDGNNCSLIPSTDSVPEAKVFKI